ncbi:MAG: hypothetical protein MRZ57_04755 [Bacteroidales bacterium]|nr:hypothetical protein [Bacteroidales bacterium]
MNDCFALAKPERLQLERYRKAVLPLLLLFLFLQLEQWHGFLLGKRQLPFLLLR